MATYNWGVDRSFQAACDISALQYRPVTLDLNGRVCGVSALSASALGILQNDPSLLGQEAVVRVLGFSKVWACGAASVLEIGGYVKTGGGQVGGVSGFKNVNAASTWALGISMESQTSGCGFVEIFFNPNRMGT